MLGGVNASKCARAEGYGNTLALTNPLTSDARSVMLRIPLPEDDGFALALPEKPRGGGRIQTGVSEA